MKTRGRLLAAATAVLALTAVTACSASNAPTEGPMVQSDPQPVDPQRCADASAEPSAPSAGSPAPDTTAARLAERGRVIVGVSSDTLGLSARQNASGSIEGFEVDLAARIAQEVTGDAANVELKVIQGADVAAALDSGQVDMVINHVPLSCQYQDQVALSEPYLTSPVAVLEREGNTAESICGDEMETLALAPGDPKLAASSPGGCLVWLQQGEVQRIAGAHVTLAGLAQQDPQTAVSTLDEQVKLSVAVDQDRADLAAYTGAVINAWRGDGGWQQSWDRWLAPLDAQGSEGNS